MRMERVLLVSSMPASGCGAPTTNVDGSLLPRTFDLSLSAASPAARMDALMDVTSPLQRRPQRRAGVIRRALRRELARIREPRRMAAMAILIVAFALAIAGMTARGESAGADAQAYWAAVRIWVEGG